MKKLFGFLVGVFLVFAVAGSASASPYTDTYKPETMILLGLGLVGLAGFGRKRLRKKLRK